MKKLKIAWRVLFLSGDRLQQVDILTRVEKPKLYLCTMKKYGNNGNLTRYVPIFGKGK
jgi:hypothetical protein